MNCGGITGAAIDMTLDDTAATVVVSQIQHISLSYGPVVPVPRLLCRVLGLGLRFGFGLGLGLRFSAITSKKCTYTPLSQD